MFQVSPGLQVDYARAYGSHDFTVAHGEVVSVLSEASWEAFSDRLISAPAPGNIALSPELITSPMPLEEIPDHRDVIEARIEEAKEASTRFPATTVILGSATFNNSTGRPANSQLFIRDGIVRAQNNKRFSINPDEKKIFTLRQAESLPQSITGRLAGLVCSDILGASAGGNPMTLGLLYEGSDETSPLPIADEAADTFLMSGCWAVPVVSDPALDRIINREDRFRFALEGSMARLFRNYPNLQDVVVADRLAPDSGVDLPYNAHFARNDGLPPL